MNRARWYLETLPAWDGVARVERVFKKPSNGRKFAAFLNDAIARAFHPGCTLGRTLVLEGPQGTCKSRFLCALGGGELYHVVGLNEPHEHEPAPPSAWIAEWAIGVDDLHLAPQRTKSFLTRTHERAPYAHASTPRAFVLAITTNDATFHEIARVSRWYRVIRSRGKFPVNFIQAHRDQLWAEALHRYLGEPSESGVPRTSARPDGISLDIAALAA